MSRKRKATSKTVPRSFSRWLVGLVVAGLAAVALFLLAAPQDVEVPDADRSLMEPQVAEKIQRHRERVSMAPRSHEAWGSLGIAFQAHGLMEEAAACYEKALELRASEFRWHYLLVHALRSVDRDAALAASERAMELQPDYPPLLVARAEILEEIDPGADVQPLYEKALALDPVNAPAELALGRIALGNGDLDSARSHLERAAELSPGAGAVHATLARLYRRLGENEKAIEEAQRAPLARESLVITDPIHYRMMQEAVSSTAQVERARELEAAGDRSGPESIYRELVVLRPDDPDMKVRLGDVLSLQGRFEEAKEHYQAALAIKSDLAAAHYGLAAALNHEGDYQGAVEHFRAALAERDDHVPTIVSLASTAGFRGDVDEAMTLYQRALEIEPDNVPALRSLAEFLFRQNRYREAVPHYRRVLEVEPEIGAVHLQLGAALAMTGDYEAAWSHLERARELGQTVPDAVIERVEAGRAPR